MRGGRTVEVSDTDAEGRLILADAIVRACEDEPDYLIEASTLTGAQLVALGSRMIGAMGDEAWRDQVAAAGNSVGELVWPMPIPEELRPALDSPVADIASLTGDKWGGMLVGGAFLGDFVIDGVPWVHLDIAGPAFNQGKPYGYTPEGRHRRRRAHHRRDDRRTRCPVRPPAQTEVLVARAGRRDNARSAEPASRHARASQRQRCRLR